MNEPVQNFRYSMEGRGYSPAFSRAKQTLFNLLVNRPKAESRWSNDNQVGLRPPGDGNPEGNYEVTRRRKPALEDR